MHPQLNSQQVMLVLGTALVIGAALILITLVYFRSLRKERKEMRMPASAPRATDDSVFLISSLQGVVASLKSREKEMEGLLREAETRAELSQRIMETTVGATPQGIMIFDSAGTLIMANHASKNMLKLDAWARRRYSDIFSSDAALTMALRGCLENTKPQASRSKYPSPDGTGRTFDVNLHPFFGRGGQIAGVVCVFSHTPARQTS